MVQQQVIVHVHNYSDGQPIAGDCCRKCFSTIPWGIFRGRSAHVFASFLQIRKADKSSIYTKAVKTLGKFGVRILLIWAWTSVANVVSISFSRQVVLSFVMATNGFCMRFTLQHWHVSQSKCFLLLQSIVRSTRSTEASLNRYELMLQNFLMVNNAFFLLNGFWRPFTKKIRGNGGHQETGINGRLVLTGKAWVRSQTLKSQTAGKAAGATGRSSSWRASKEKGLPIWFVGLGFLLVHVTEQENNTLINWTFKRTAK